MVIESILGVLAGGLGSWISKGIGLYENKQKYQHEYKLLEMQMKARQSETENELAIAQEESFAAMRAASYQHDASAGITDRWVNNTLRLVRPILTVFLIFLVGAIWFTVAERNIALQGQIVEGVLFMASAAFAWWFGDRAPISKKLPWQ